MAALTIPVVGEVCGFTEDPYAFEDPDTGKPVEGVSRVIYVVTAFDEAPKAVKLKPTGHEGVADAIRKAGPRARVSFTAVVRARREEVVLMLDTAGKIEPAAAR